MGNDKSIFGCFFRIGFDPSLNEHDFSNLANIFRSYIWGENGIDNHLKTLNNEDYGNDLKLALFEFQVKPGPFELQNIKAIESYRKNEKSVGIPIIVNDENFFDKSEEARHDFLKQVVLQKLDLLAELVKKRKLDTNIELLKADTKNILSNW